MRLWSKNVDDALIVLEDEEFHSDKSVLAYRTISEVADHLHLPQHVLRFWETKFPQIKPLKRGGGRRFYKPEDVDFLRGIRHLLYSEGYTIKGVQKLIKTNGIRAIQLLGQPIAPTPQNLDFHAERNVSAATEKNTSIEIDVVNNQNLSATSLSTKENISNSSVFSNDINIGLDQVEETTINTKILGNITHNPNFIDDDLCNSDGFSNLHNLLNNESIQAETIQSSKKINNDMIKQLQIALFTLLECKKIIENVNKTSFN